MLSDLLKQRIDARPFRPFVICRADGRDIAVDHPEFIMISPGGSTAVVFVGDEVAEIIPIGQVARIRTEAGPSRRSGSSWPVLTIRPVAKFSIVRLMVVVAAFALELAILQAAVPARPGGRGPSALGWIGLGTLLVLGPTILVFLTLFAIPRALQRVARWRVPPRLTGQEAPPDARPRHGTA